MFTLRAGKDNDWGGTEQGARCRRSGGLPKAKVLGCCLAVRNPRYGLGTSDLLKGSHTLDLAVRHGSLKASLLPGAWRKNSVYYLVLKRMFVLGPRAIAS